MKVVDYKKRHRDNEEFVLHIVLFKGAVYSIFLSDDEAILSKEKKRQT